MIVGVMTELHQPGLLERMRETLRVHQCRLTTEAKYVK
jgi:hypothetical protein